MKKWFCFFLIILNLNHAYAEENYWGDHTRGWHWYEVEPEVDDTPDVKNITSQNNTESATQQLDAVKQAVIEARAKAVLSPTVDNVRNYIALQNTVSANAEYFTKIWKQVLWMNPELNLSLVKPTSRSGKEAKREKETQENQALLQEASKQFGLFFFFEGECPYCQRFAPTLKSVATRYGFSVLPISLDGLGLPDYPTPEKDKGQAERFHITRWPTLLMVNPKTNLVIPVTQGLLSETDLTERLIYALKKANIYENRK